MAKKKLTISDYGVAFIKREEGKHDGDKTTAILEPQRDPIGLYTLGFGSRYDINGVEVTKHTRPITEAEAETLLRRDIGIVESCIAQYVTRDITQNQYDALCSIIFNIGVGAFKKSLLLKNVNTGTVKQSHFTNWKNAGGKPILLQRRLREYALFIT